MREGEGFAWGERERERDCPMYATRPKNIYSEGPKVVICISSNAVSASSHPLEVYNRNYFNVWTEVEI